jgi:hypothetical protein
MQVAAGVLMFVLAFAMLFAGIGLFIGGEITFKSGKKIPKDASRKAAAALVSFIPLFVVARTILRWFDPEQTIPIESISWPMAGACLILAGTWLLRGMSASKPRPSYPAASAASPFETNEQPAAAIILPEFDEPPKPAAPAPRSADPKPRRKSPFDFS